MVLPEKKDRRDLHSIGPAHSIPQGKWPSRADFPRAPKCGSALRYSIE
jgi:hypothetical protein